MRLSFSVLSPLLGPTGICRQRRAKRRANDFFSSLPFQHPKTEGVRFAIHVYPFRQGGPRKGGGGLVFS